MKPSVVGSAWQNANWFFLVLQDISRPGCNRSMCCVSSECASGWSCVVWFGKFSDVLANTGLFVQVLAMDPFEVAVSSHQSWWKMLGAACGVSAAEDLVLWMDVGCVACFTRFLCVAALFVGLRAMLQPLPAVCTPVAR